MVFLSNRILTFFISFSIFLEPDLANYFFNEGYVNFC